MFIEGCEPFGEEFLDGEGVRGCALKVLEEASEAREALCRMEKADECGGPLDAIVVEAVAKASALLELADTAQEIENALTAMGATSDEWWAALMEVRERNELRGRYGR